MGIFRFIVVGLCIIFICSCVAGHKDFNGFRNEEIGTVIAFKEVFTFERAGELYRADFVIVGQGLTHIDKGADGSLIYHFSSQEILPNAPTKEWIGKCLFYYVVDPETYVIKEWGFDKGGNPLSCRTWL